MLRSDLMNSEMIEIYSKKKKKNTSNIIEIETCAHEYGYFIHGKSMKLHRKWKLKLDRELDFQQLQKTTKIQVDSQHVFTVGRETEQIFSPFAGIGLALLSSRCSESKLTHKPTWVVNHVVHF